MEATIMADKDIGHVGADEGPRLVGTERLLILTYKALNHLKDMRGDLS